MGRVRMGREQEERLRRGAVRRLLRQRMSGKHASWEGGEKFAVRGGRLLYKRDRWSYFI